MYFVYILKSKINDSYYIGHTHDIKNRLHEHNAGRVRSTKAKRPWKLHYVEEYSSKSEAFRRELFFKSIDGYLYLKNKQIK